MDKVNMSKLSLYSVKRLKKGNALPWSPPFYAPSDDIAIECLVELSHNFPELAKSYVYKVASFNPITGDIVKLRKPKLIKYSPKPKEVKKDEIVQN